MGIRMLNRRPVSSTPLAPVPAFAAGASSARLALGPAEALRHTVKEFRHRFPPAREPDPVRPDDPAAWRLWTELARGRLALLLTLLPRTRRSRTVTVFIAPALTPPPPDAPAGRHLPWSGGPGPGTTH
ncbi:hypothetical protein ACIQNG_27615 [Streptomyces sp. NPDC091377]|uniref:hypothetical protein n=1 Tax=Streptomyces sp. NPDC091377 TaxID=3365995 RepID=UPI0037F15DA6